MPTILQFGTTGQVARELIRRAPAMGVQITALSREDADLTHPEMCADAITHAGALDVVINAAAYTAVDQAESDEATALRVNGDAPGVMARACASRGIPLLHISTDYVFDGSARDPYPEDTPVNPLGAYGWTKLAGEQAVLAADGPAVILRTAWVFSAFGKNFVRTMLRLGAERDELGIVDDQRGGPTAAADIADALLTIAAACAAGHGQWGVFHFCGAPIATWRQFAEAIFERSLPPDRRPRVRPIRTEDYPTPARRPANSALDCRKIDAAYGIAQPSWEVSLGQVIEELQRGG